MIGMISRVLACAAIGSAFLAFASLATADSATDWKCTATTEVPIDERIAACTSVLDSGKFGQQGAIRAHFNRAAAYNRKGEYDHAIADYDELIRLYPQNMYAYYCRAYSYYQLGDYDHALADYDRVIWLSPRNLRAYYSRGVTHVKMGSFDRAIADYSKVIEFKSDPSGAIAGADGAYYHGGDLAPASSSQAVPSNSTYAAAYLARGAAQSRKGNSEDAIADYERAMQLDPNYRVAYVYRAAEYRAKRDLTRGMADCDRAASLEPKDVYTHICRGLTYLAMGDSERANTACDRAIELDPKVAGLYRPCAMAQLQAGSPAKAVTYLDRSKELDPKDSYTALWREIAARRSNAPSTLSDATAKLDMTKWPAPVIRLFLGTTTADEVLHAAEDPDPIKKKGQICEANFFTAEVALQRGVMEEARRLFALALADCPPTFVEAQAAAVELKALGVNP